MSRSRRKRPFAPICGSSQKSEKTAANRALRRVTRVEVEQGSDVLTCTREASNVYSWPQDGTRRYRRRSKWRRSDDEWRRWVVAK
jgi:hypothetical protein